MDEYAEAIKNENLVKLTIGAKSDPEPLQSFLVPRSLIVHHWTSSPLFQLLKDAEEGPIIHITPASRSSTESSSGSTELSNDPASFFSSHWQEENSTKTAKVKVKDKSKAPKRQNTDLKSLPVEIQLPEDNAEAWSTFLFWSASPTNSLPDRREYVDGVEFDTYLVRCWNFGRKYGFLEFTDDIMIALITLFQQYETSSVSGMYMSLQTVRETYCTDHPKRSRILMKFISEELAKSEMFTHCKLGHISEDEIDVCKHCWIDRDAFTQRVRCLRRSKDKQHDHPYPLDADLWRHFVNAKSVYRCAGRQNYCRNRLGRLPKGKAPAFMQYLLSDKRAELRTMFPGE